MRRREFIALVGGTVALPLSVRAQARQPLPSRRMAFVAGDHSERRDCCRVAYAAAWPATAGFVRLPVAVFACLVVRGPSEYPLGLALKLGRRKLDRRKTWLGIFLVKALSFVAVR